MFVLYSLSVSLCRGMASKALLMSIVVQSVLSAGIFELMPSKTCWVRLVSRVFVECSGRSPCWVGARGTSGWIMFSIRRSVISDGVQSSVMGLKEDVVGSLFGFSIAMILPCFQMFGIGQWE